MRIVKGEDGLFVSLQGEGMLSGTPMTFLRLWGCNLKCPWCDQPEALKPRGYINVSVDEVFEGIVELGCLDLCITGGEPLIQAEEVAELSRKLSQTHGITVETNASIFHPIPQVNFWSLSPKLHKWPDEEVLLWIDHCTQYQVPFQMKVVCNSVADVTSAITLLGDYRTLLMVQPQWGTENLEDIIAYCVEQNVRLSFQTHKWLGIR